jgi:hypothetical protein
MYCLLDANLVLGYDLPRALDFTKARERICVLVDSVRSGQSTHFLYVPNFAIAEVFSNFAKYSFGRYNRQLKKNCGTIDTRIYQKLCDQFHHDIHNGRLFYQVELNRYHVLGVDLVAPIDHYFKNQRKQKFSNPAGTFDQLIVAMSVHLGHIHGIDKVVLLTADTRLAQVVEKCRRKISPNTIERLKLTRAQDVAGKAFSPNIFPEAIHLSKCGKYDLARLFGRWPLPVGKISDAYRLTGRRDR